MNPVELRQCRKCGQIVLAGDDGIPILADMTLLVGAATIPVLIHPDRALVDFKKSGGRYLFIRRAPKTGVLPQKAWLAEHWCTGRRVRKDDTVPLVGRTGPLPGPCDTLHALGWESKGECPRAASRAFADAQTDITGCDQCAPPPFEHARQVPGDCRGRAPLDACSRCHGRFQPGAERWSVDIPGHPMWTSHVDTCPPNAQQQAIAALKQVQ